MIALPQTDLKNNKLIKNIYSHTITNDINKLDFIFQIKAFFFYFKKLSKLILSNTK